MSLHLRLFYYAVGLHFVRLVYPTSFPGFEAMYGGLLEFDDAGTLIKKPSTVYYKTHYKYFYNKCIDYVDGVTEDKKKLPKVPENHKRCVIQLDFENFYDNINYSNFFDFLEQSHHHKQASTELLMKLMVHAEKGLPQTCNDVVVSCISSMYLNQFDHLLNNWLKDKFNNKFFVLRYCDDTHIFIDYEKSMDVKEIASSVILECKSILYYNYQLRMNNKTVYYDLHNDDDRKTYRSSLKNLSHTNEDTDIEIKKYIKADCFEDWKKEFEDSVSLYLDADLIKGSSLSPDINVGLTRIYHQQFRHDLIQDYKENSPFLLINKIKRIYSYAKPVHLHDKPKLFVFFARICSDLLNLTNLAAEHEFYGITMLEFYIEFQQESYKKAFLKSDLFKRIESKIRNKTPYTYSSFDFSELKSNKVGYLSWFSVKRRHAEQLKMHSEALSYLNSELCILLTLLKIPQVKENSHNPVEIPYSLESFHGANQTALNGIRMKRNRVDVTHNQLEFPDFDSFNSFIDPEEYVQLKNNGLNAVIELNRNFTKTPVLV